MSLRNQKYEFRHFENGHFTNEYYAIKPTDVVSNCLLRALESQRYLIHKKIGKFNHKRNTLADLKKQRTDLKEQISTLLNYKRSDSEIIDEILDTEIKSLTSKLAEINKDYANQKKGSFTLKKIRKDLNREIKVHNTIVDELTGTTVGKIDAFG